jgi:UDP-2-acetamido-2-deoxy-ribo-hexuluronate aminotransferase
VHFIDLKQAYRAYRSEFDCAIQGVLDSTQYILGPEVERCEKDLARFAGVKHAIGVGNGTDSLQLALMALGIGPGDEVITVPFTFVSSASVIRLVGATPVFVDVEADTFCMDPFLLEEKITERTRAIIPVSLYGQIPDMETICAIADRHGIAVIEDGAQSFGAERNGKRSGSLSTVASTSFYPSKPLGSFGDGGMLFTDDDALAEQLRLIRTHGSVARDSYHHLGMNSRLDAIQAAVVRVKVVHLEEELAARRRIADFYNEQLAECCVVPKETAGSRHAWGVYTVRSHDRDGLQSALREQGVPSVVYYAYCLHLQPIFRDLGYSEGDFPVAEQMANEVLSLPMHPWLTHKECEQVVGAVQNAHQPVRV